MINTDGKRKKKILKKVQLEIIHARNKWRRSQDAWFVLSVNVSVIRTPSGSFFKIVIAKGVGFFDPLRQSEQQYLPW